MSRRALAVLVALAASSALMPHSAVAATSKGGAKTLKTRVLVKKFVVTKTGLKAFGSASTSIGQNGTRQLVTLAAATGSTCQVLTLRLDRLNLSLLGLTVNASAINLRVTGNRARTLGALFCRLATATRIGNIASARAAAASLNRRLRQRPMQVVGFNAVIRPQKAPAQAQPSTAPEPSSGSADQAEGGHRASAAQASGPICRVLDLTLGPLNLDLLGLVVDLYGRTRTDPIKVSATADPNGGLLGKTFCELSSPPPPPPSS